MEGWMEVPASILPFFHPSIQKVPTHFSGSLKHAQGFYDMRQFSIQSLILISALWLSACGGIQLVDIPKSSAALNLSKAQQATVEPKIALIHDIVEDYEFEKHELEADYLRYRNHVNLTRLGRYEGRRSGDSVIREQNELRTKARNFAIQRKAYAKEIAGLTDEIKANLSDEQLAVFEGLKQPELELPDLFKKPAYNEFAHIPGTRGARPDDF